MSTQTPGQIGWLDLTVPDADNVSEFYQNVVGWTPAPVSMGDYNDYTMSPAGGDGTPVAGVCHARGSNAALPAVWLPYFIVTDIDASVSACKERGGQIVKDPPATDGGGGRFCVIRDPAGAFAALFQPPAVK
ncbi:MAG: VOC family protein [Bryobacteraceae bacterium]|nr:VOC family protein [Bryobacteraceae bacterium]